MARPRVHDADVDLMQISVILPRPLFEKLSKRANEQQVARAAYVRDLIEKAVDGQEGI